MARARNIKPSLFTNELLGTLDPLITILFTGLWCLADKDGILEDRPLRIKAEIFPYRNNVDVNGYLTVMEQNGFITRYQVDGVGYIHVTNFLKHQSPHHTEKAKGFPKPEQGVKTLTVKHPLVYGESQVSTRSDSLIPDSLIPELNTLSGSPDVQSRSEEKKDATEVLSFLNLKANRRYKPVPANIKLIAARLREGASVAECRQVIAKKCREWGTDEKMAEYLRPATLFNATKFAQYIGELGND